MPGAHRRDRPRTAPRSLLTRRRSVADEAVLYFDVLGFRAKAAGSGTSAVDALSALAQVLSASPMTALTSKWTHRYALSDSVFLTHADPLHAVRQAAALSFSVTPSPAAADEPVLVRGGIGFGPVRHVRGIFLTSAEPANLVGEGVLEAVRLEQVGLKGPRLLLADALVRQLKTQDAELVRWLLRPTDAPGVWEVLWPLPDQPSALEGEELSIKDLCAHVVRLLRAHGGHPTYGEQYREF